MRTPFVKMMCILIAGPMKCLALLSLLNCTCWLHLQYLCTYSTCVPTVPVYLQYLCTYSTCVPTYMVHLDLDGAVSSIQHYRSFTAFPEVENVTSTSNPVEGQLLEIVCTVSGTPTPTIQWFKDDEVVLSQGRDSLRISITGDGLSSIININSASLSNNGIYRCMASNEAGSVSKTLEIQVKSGMI